VCLSTWVPVTRPVFKLLCQSRYSANDDDCYKNVDHIKYSQRIRVVTSLVAMSARLSESDVILLITSVS